MGTTRAPKGSGSVTPARDSHGNPIKGAWRICDKWTDAGGQPHRYRETVHCTKTQARKKLEEIKAERKHGIDRQGAARTFADFAATWQEGREQAGQLAYKTLLESGRHVRVLSDYIGEMRLADITPETIERLFLDMRKDRQGKGGQPISGRTLQAYYQTLRAILAQACRYDYILRNPCDRVNPPRAKDVERRALSRADAKRLMEAIAEAERHERATMEAKEHRAHVWKSDAGRRSIRGLHGLAYLQCVRIGLLTGMRLGEILALTWERVDLDRGRILVAGSLQANGKTREPKTKAGRRTVWIDRESAERLRDWKRIQGEYLAKIGITRPGQEPPAGTPVICSDVGGHANENNFGTWWRKWRDAHGFQGLKFHELRHTQATQLLACGVDVKTVQARLGHADPALTLKWYAHQVDELAAQAGEIMGNMLVS